MNRIGIIQGRLSPPVNGRIQVFPKATWAEEFSHAQAAGLRCLEWVYGLYGEPINPLASADGQAQMKVLVKKHRVEVSSVCADYFMDRPLLRVSEAARRVRVDRLRWLLRQCGTVGINRVVLPFVDRSEIRTQQEVAIAVGSIRAVLPDAKRWKIELHLETSLSPQRFHELLHKLDSPLVKVTYDIGNSASLGYDSREEFAAYGERIGSVHVKDRLRNGPSVPLGEGAADFPTCFALLKARGYRGDLILQVARGSLGEEVTWARQNRDFVVSHWTEV